MTGYMQLVKLDYALGGIALMGTGPIPPVLGMEELTTEEAQSLASYYGDDIRVMMWHGNEDVFYPGEYYQELYQTIFDNLGISDVVEFKYVQEGLEHVESLPAFV